MEPEEMAKNVDACYKVMEWMVDCSVGALVLPLFSPNN